MPHVLCKVSGLVTEMTSESLDEAVVRRYLDTALELFGANRLLFGSDWPVCLLRASYAEVCRIIEDWTAALSPHEQSLIWGGNALRCYGLRLGNKAPAEPAPWT
jgi:L-fuconolactonase